MASVLFPEFPATFVPLPEKEQDRGTWQRHIDKHPLNRIPFADTPSVLDRSQIRIQKIAVSAPRRIRDAEKGGNTHCGAK